MRGGRREWEACVSAPVRCNPGSPALEELSSSPEASVWENLFKDFPCWHVQMLYLPTKCPGILISFLVAVRNTPTKATQGRKGLFWLTVQVPKPSWQGSQEGRNWKQLVI